MARRVGVDKDQVIDAALAVLDAQGRPEAVTLAAVAAGVGIRTQSIYAHVEGAAGLRRELALATLAELEEQVTMAAVGRSGPDAVRAILIARLDYALGHVGRFAAAIHPPGADSELEAAIAAVSRPLAIVAHSCGVAQDDLVHWDRIALAATYGLALMNRDGQITLPVSVDESTVAMIDWLVAAWPAVEVAEG